MEKYGYGTVNTDTKGNYTIPGAEVKRDSQVSQQLAVQEKLISELAMSIDNLERALEVVTRKLGTPIEAQKETEQLVPLAMTLKTNNDFLIRNISRISTLTNTIEL